MASHLRFENVTRRFGDFTAVRDLSLEIEKGETFSLLGPSGCGKTTLLRMAAGFDRPDSGRIFLDDRDITSLPPERRPVNTVFQSYALFPHLSLRDNIAFGPRLRKLSAARVREQVDRMLDLVDLAAHADKMPAQLSGGQRQRVAIARALVNQPEVLLLDEPLAALDLKLRQRLLVELDAIHDEVGITFLYVTHDQSEAMSISDRIAVMNQGAIEQIGRPAEIYEAPRSSFVAAFIGDTNFLDGVVSGRESDHLARFRAGPLGELVFHHDRTPRVGDAVHLSLRPEKIGVSWERPHGGPHDNAVQGEIEDVIYFGSHTRYRVRAGGRLLCAQTQHRGFRSDEGPPAKGDPVWLHWHAHDGFILESYREEDAGLLHDADA